MKAVVAVTGAEGFIGSHLVEALVRAGMRTRCHPIDGYWLDIGRVTDYEKAQSDFDEVFR